MERAAVTVLPPNDIRFRFGFPSFWDERIMAHKKSLQALHRTLQDLRSDRYPMGGVPVLLRGDFRQTLPVIPRSTPADGINACLRSSVLWRNVNVINLRQNMRIINELRCDEFA